MKAALTEAAKEIGIAEIKVAPVDPPLRRQYFEKWIGEGKHGEMAWMERNNERRLNPGNVLPEARSIVCVALDYWQPLPERRGTISRYALGKDYHKVLLKKLKQLCTAMQGWGGAQKPYVDTGPVLEKPVAAAAGIGWQGKHTILIRRRGGTFFFIGVILTTLDLPEDAPVEDKCGMCTKCIDVCPTQAIVGPYKLDARRCIAYLTIEHSGAIPMEFREAIGDHLFGCDDCQDVCPWNRYAQTTQEQKFQARPMPDPRELLEWDDEQFHNAFAGTPIRRTGLRLMQRNSLVVLGNIGEAADRPVLEKVARGSDEMLAEHALWALDRLEKRGV
jgi:epoxyqueuosine reductase